MSDTILASIATTASLDFGGLASATFSSRIDHIGDDDWIRVTLLPGQTYEFFVHMDKPGSAEGDSDLRILSASGTFLAYNDDNVASVNSHLSFASGAGGTIFLAIREHIDNSRGSYSIFATRTVATNSFFADGHDSASATGAQRLVGGGGDDTLNLSTLGREALGEQGNDTLIGNALANVMAGGLGNDFAGGAAGDDQLWSDDGDDSLNGNTENDLLFGGDGDDDISGGTGTDTLDGGAGEDRMIGGLHSDTYVVDNVSDTVSESSLEGTADTVRSSISLVLPNEVEILILTGAANLSGTGNSLANQIDGNSGNNVLTGGGGVDTLRGGAGKDTYVLANESDVVTDAAGIDTITSTITRSLANYTAIENLTLLGTLAANGGGTNGTNVIIGNNAANQLRGLGGNDTLNGLGGNDVLIGGAGRDVMTGGVGADRYDFDSINDTKIKLADRITDFRPRTDKIDLSTIDANGSAAGHKFSFLREEGSAFTGARGELRWFQSDRSGTANDRTYVQGDINGNRKADFQIELYGLKTLAVGDFIL